MRTATVNRIAGAVLIASVACTDSPITTPREVSADVTFSATAESELATYMDALNVQLEAEGAPYRVAIAEYITGPDAGEAGNTVLSKVVGDKQLPHDFVPFDPRRAGWSGPTTGAADNVTFAIDQTGDAVPVFGGLTGAQTTAAILAAMGTWDGVNCSTLPLAENPTFGLDVGIVAFQNGLGGSPFIFADVQHAGWRDINFAGGILGVTFTFIFVSAGVPTDINGDGRLDAAFREIYYDPSFSWANNGIANVDVETVALHEVGHGLSQAHFGTIMRQADGSLIIAPRAVMNALYAGPLRVLQGPDNGGHCTIWYTWPTS